MQEKWNACLRITQSLLSPELFNTWIPPIKPIGLEGQKLKLEIPNKEFANIMVEKVGREFGEALRQCFGANIGVDWCLAKDENPNAQAGRAFTGSQAPTAHTPKTAQVVQPQAPKAADFDSQLIPEYSFENFCQGTSNRVALTMARSIVQHPEQHTFNPFFLYGAPGVGKTHLVNAVGMAVKQMHPEWRVLMVSAAVFQTQYTAASTGNHNELNNFIYFYQSIDLLIIDDFQAMTGPKTLSSFFHIFNHLHKNKRTILITCDRPPSEFEGLEERMLTRLKWGVTVELERPDIGLRRAILENKLRRHDLRFPDEVIDYIAENVADNVRELQGTINSMLAFMMADDCELDLDLAKRVVPRLVNQSRKELTFQMLAQGVCNHCGVRQNELLSKTRQAKVAAARQLLMYLTQKYTKLSLTQIGRELGGRDHSTVRHACTSIERRLSTDKAFRRDIEQLESSLK